MFLLKVWAINAGAHYTRQTTLMKVHLSALGLGLGVFTGRLPPCLLFLLVLHKRLAFKLPGVAGRASILCVAAVSKKGP